MSELATDRGFLTSQMYATDEPLAVRIRTHQKYTEPKMDFTSWVLLHVPWNGDNIVLDIGCGSGAYVEAVCSQLTRGGQLLGADLSMGMLKDLAAKPLSGKVALINADATMLPLPDASCDVILANHMLYHVPEIERALAEFQRVLRSGGYLVAATNARYSMETLFTEILSACAALQYPCEIPTSVARTRFTLENGSAQIEPFFAGVERDTFESHLVFPDAAPAVAYINSLRHIYGPHLPEGLSWEALMAQVQHQIASAVHALGEYRVAKTSGVFVGKKSHCV